MPEIDFAAHAGVDGRACGQGCLDSRTGNCAEGARDHERTSVVVIDTDALMTTEAGGHWWDVAVPEVSERAEVREKRAAYEEKIKGQRIG